MLNILLVEDNELYRLQFADFLRRKYPSMKIDEAFSEERTLYLVDNYQHDIVFMDIRLPNANGIALTSKIKSSYPQIPVVIVTGHDEIEYFQAAEQAGADHFFTKCNLDRKKIVEILDALIEKKNAIRH